VFYLFWVPGFLQSQHGLALTRIGAPIVVIYLLSDVGSVAAGWLSSSMIKRGSTVNAARKIAMLIVRWRHARCVCIPGGEHVVCRTADRAGSCVSSRFSANCYTNLRHVSRLAPWARSWNRRHAGAIGGLFIATVVGHVLNGPGATGCLPD